jgi:hypothetical protein
MPPVSAPLCDAAELEVRVSRCGAAARLADAPARAAQAGSLASPDWPHALHVLGHIVNNDLCAPAPRRAFVLGVPPQTCAVLPAPLTRRARSEAARLVWKRLPAGVKEARPLAAPLSRLHPIHCADALAFCALQGDAELAAVWALLQALWTRDYAVRPRSPPASSVPRPPLTSHPRALLPAAPHRPSARRSPPPPGAPPPRRWWLPSPQATARAR